MRHFSKIWVSMSLAIAGLASASFASAQSSSCTAAQTSQQFTYTGVAQSLTVPAGVVSINMYISGAQGGSGGGANPGAGGLGGRVTGKLNVTAGDVLHVYVGGQGTVFNGAALGGASGGGIGGGASDVRLGADLIANRVAVAGGGGGGGSTGCVSSGTIIGGGGAGGIGGGGAGTAGGDSETDNNRAGGGAGGTLGVGGAAGIGCAGFLGAVGSNSGTGGDGQGCCCAAVPGGGGGGGGDVVGGGGGGGSAGTTGCAGNSKGAGGGGGGGSSMATGLTETSIVNGVQSSNGLVEMCMNKATDLAITNNNSSTTAVIGVTATYTILASNAGPSGVVNATVSHIMPVACTSLRWTCSGAGGAICSASGTGSINDVVNMPVGSTLTYLASCLVSTTATGVLSGTASIAAPFDVTDTNLANNSASGSATLVTPAAAAASGGGCTMGSTDAPFDPSLPLLVLLAVAGILRVRSKTK